MTQLKKEKKKMHVSQIIGVDIYELKELPYRPIKKAAQIVNSSSVFGKYVE